MAGSNSFSMRSALALWGWLSYPLLWWVRVKDVSEDLDTKTLVRPDIKTIFVMPRRSLSDYLVLRHFCRKLGLPKPTQTLKQVMFESFEGRGGYIFLEKLGWLGRIRSADLEQRPMDYIVDKLNKSQGENVNLVPVSILWGRNPRKDRKSSLLKLLFFDDEHAGILQKIFIVLIQGRDTVISFGKPINVREQMEVSSDTSQVGKKIRRVLRVHFRNQRNAILGPKAYDHYDVVEYLTSLPRMQAAITEASEGNPNRRLTIEKSVRGYFSEIAAAQSYSFVRFAKICLDYITKKVFRSLKVYHDESIRKLANDYEVIYCSVHRSHVDYLLLPYWLYNLGLSAIHIAAGVNLSVWPLGVFLRRCGAFFLRRSFKGNHLYSLAFHEYLSFMIVRGHSIGFFPEGGRSRTGRTLDPKTGMLSMIVQSYLRDPIKPMAFVPVYIGYDKVAEIASHVRELRGGKKEKESFLQLLKARHVLSRDHGNAYLSFGEPVILNDFLKKNFPDWEASQAQTDTKKNPELVKLVKKLAYQISWNTNEASVIGDVGIVSTVLLSINQRALTQDHLEGAICGLRDLLSAIHADSRVVVRSEEPSSIISLVEGVSSLRRLSVDESDPRSDVLFLDEMASMFSNYYRNNTAHLFVVPSFIATVAENSGGVHKEQLLKLFDVWWPLLSYELVLNSSSDYYKSKLDQSLEFMTARGLLYYEPEKGYRSAAPHSDSFVQFSVLSNMHRPLLRRFGLSVLVLELLSKNGSPVTLGEVQKRSEIFVRKMSLLLGAFDMDLARSNVFDAILRHYKNCGLLRPTENDRYVVDEAQLSVMVATAHSLLNESEVEGLKRAKIENKAVT